MSKNILTAKRLVLNGWGPADQLVIPFVGRKTGMYGPSGAGKTSCIDAIQTILYGRTLSRDYNLATDERKDCKGENREYSGYLYGQTKNYGILRENYVFNSNIYIEWYDEKKDRYILTGVAWEINEGISPGLWFICYGKAPDDLLANKSHDEIIKYVSECSFKYNLYSPELNKTFKAPNKTLSCEAYQRMLAENVFGMTYGNYIKRYIKMMHDVISVRPEETLENCIKNFWYPNEDIDNYDIKEGPIAKFSERVKMFADAEKKLQNKEDEVQSLEYPVTVANRCIELNAEIKTKQDTAICIKKELADRQLAKNNTEIALSNSLIQEETQKRVEATNRKENTTKEIWELEQQKENHPYEKKKSEKESWEKIYRKRLEIEERLRLWNKNPDLKQELDGACEDFIDDFLAGKAPKTDLKDFQKQSLEDCNRALEIAREYEDQARELKKSVNQKQEELDGYRNDKKPYKVKNIHQVCRELNDYLEAIYGKKNLVQIFSRCFNIVDEKWRNAIEGCLSQKASLIVAPKYFADAERCFYSLPKSTRGSVRLINTKRMMEKSIPLVEENSLYECFSKEEEYIDRSLKYYTGRIIKCETEEDIKKHGNSIMPNCYYHNNRQLYFLNEADYTTFASIGKTIPQSKIKNAEDELEELTHKYNQTKEKANAYFKANSMETLANVDESDFKDWLVAKQKIIKLTQELNAIETGDYAEIDRIIQAKTKEKESLEKTIRNCEESIRKNEVSIEAQNRENEKIKEDTGYIRTEHLSEEIHQMAANWIKARQYTRYDSATEFYNTSEIQPLREERDKCISQYQKAMNTYLINHSALDNLGIEPDEESLKRTINAYEEKKTQIDTELRLEVEKARLDELREGRRDIIEKLVGQIKKADQRRLEINRVLRENPFSESVFVLEIHKSAGEMGQYYEMLTSDKWDEWEKQLVGETEMFGQVSIMDLNIDNAFGETADRFFNNFRPQENNETSAAYENRCKKWFDYRNYIQFTLKERRADDENATRVRARSGKDSGGEGKTPVYVVLFTAFNLLYNSTKDNSLTAPGLILLDETFQGMDATRRIASLRYMDRLGLQVLFCTPDADFPFYRSLVDGAIGLKVDSNGKTGAIVKDFKNCFKEEEDVPTAV